MKKLLKKSTAVLLAVIMMMSLFTIMPFSASAASSDENGTMSGKLEFNGHYYKIYNNLSYTWEEAEKYCESLGGYLVTITSQDEMNFIINEINNKEANSNCYWIGLRQSAIGWSWVTNENFSYANWAANEPNNYQSEGENYVHLFGKQYTKGDGIKYLGDWNDVTNEGASYASDFYSLENFGFICEWDYADTTQYDDATKPYEQYKAEQTLENYWSSGYSVSNSSRYRNVVEQVKADDSITSMENLTKLYLELSDLADLDFRGMTEQSKTEYYYEIVLTDLLIKQNSSSDFNTNVYNQTLSFANNIESYCKSNIKGVIKDGLKTNLTPELKSELKNGLRNYDILSSEMDVVNIIVEGAEIIGDFFDEISTYLAVKNLSVETIEILKNAAENTTNTALKNALNNFADAYTSSLDSLVDQAADKTASEAIFFLLEKTASTCFSALPGTVVAKCITSGGKLVSNLLSGSETTSTLYLQMSATYEIEDAVRTATVNSKDKLSENNSLANCKLFNAGFDLMLNIANYGNDLLIDYSNNLNSALITQIEKKLNWSDGFDNEIKEFKSFGQTYIVDLHNKVDMLYNKYIYAYPELWDEALTNYIGTGTFNLVSFASYDYNIVAVANDDSVPEGTTLNVRDLSDDEKELVNNAIDKRNLINAYDISLYNDGVQIQVDADGYIIIRIPIPEGVDTNHLVIYRVDENGEKISYKARIVDGMIEFRTNHFSIYALALDDISAYVSTAKSVHYHYVSNEGNIVDVTYKIPKILINSLDANKVNTEILSTYESAFEMVEQIKDFKGDELLYTELDYDYYVNDRILSVIIHLKYPNNNYTEYSVYNFDIITGKLLTNEDIANNMSMDYEKIKEQIADEMESKFNEVKGFVQEEFYNQQYQKSISDENLEFSRLYIAENNQLMAMYRMYWVAGAEIYYYLMPIDNSIDNDTFTVTATSNISSPVSEVYSKDDKTVTVTYYLKTEKTINYGEWYINYDPTILKPSETLNVDENGDIDRSVMPIMDGGTAVNLHYSDNQVCGNFSKVSSYDDDYGYDFSNNNLRNNPFISVTFDIIGDYTEDTEINLNVYVLNRYINNGKIDSSFYSECETLAELSKEPYTQKLQSDVNGDGEYNILDAAAIQLYKAKLYNGIFNESVADTNGDGVIDILDAAHIQLDLAKLL